MYRDMTDVEAKAAVKEICRRCERFATDEEANAEVRRLIKEELGYGGPTSVVTSTSTSSGSMTMRMFMVMLTGPSDETIQT